MESVEFCGHKWTDGWGDHICNKLKDHGFSDHTCKCDQRERNTTERFNLINLSVQVQAPISWTDERSQRVLDITTPIIYNFLSQLTEKMEREYGLKVKYQKD